MNKVEPPVTTSGIKHSTHYFALKHLQSFLIS